MKKKIAVVLGSSLAVLLGCVVTLLACGDMASISGTVTSSFSGQPLNTNWEAWVSLWTENYSWYTQDNLSDEDRADGKYSYSGLSPDDYTVSASAYGYQGQSQDVTLSPGSSAVVNFALDPIVANIAADVVALDTVNGTETGGWRTVKVDVKYQEMCHDPRRLMVWVVGATSGTTVIYDSGENSYLDLWNCRDTSITNNPTWSGYDTVYHLAFYWDTTYFANEGYTIMAALQTNDPHGDGIDINPDPAATTWVHQAGAFPTGPTDPGTPGGTTVSVSVVNAVITAYKATSSPLPGHDQDAFLYDPDGASALSNPTFEVTVDYWESLPMEIVVWLAATAWGDTRPLPEYDPYALLEFTGPGTYTVTWDGTNPGYTGWTGEWGTWSFDVDFNVVNTLYDYVIDHFYAKTHDGQSTYYDVLVSSNHSVWWYYDETATPPGYQFRCNYVLNGGSGVAPTQVDMVTLRDLTVQATNSGLTTLGVLHDNIVTYPSSGTVAEDATLGTWRTVFTGQTASGAEHRRDHSNPRILATNRKVERFIDLRFESDSNPELEESVGAFMAVGMALQEGTLKVYREKPPATGTLPDRYAELVVPQHLNIWQTDTKTPFTVSPTAGDDQVVVCDHDANGKVTRIVWKIGGYSAAVGDSFETPFYVESVEPGTGNLVAYWCESSAGTASARQVDGNVYSDTVRVSVLTVIFSKAGTEGANGNNYGYDGMDTAETSDDHVSVATDGFTYVNVRILGAPDASEISFHTTDETVAEATAPLSTPANGFLLKVDGKSFAGDVSLYAVSQRLVVTGIFPTVITTILGEITVNVYEPKIATDWKIYPVEDKTSILTSFIMPIELTEATLLATAKPLIRPAVMEIQKATIAEERDDVEYDVNDNGSYDYYSDGGAQMEFPAIVAAGLSGPHPTAVVRNLNFAWRLSQPAASGQKKIQLPAATKYLKVGDSCTLGLGANKEPTALVVDGISPTFEVTFDRELTMPHTAGEELFCDGLAGIASDPIVVEPEARALIHELLHMPDFGGLEDVNDPSDASNIMNYGAQTTPLRFKPLIERYTTPSDTESQWETVPR